MDPQYYIKNNPFKEPPRENQRAKAVLGVLLLMALFALITMDRGAAAAVVSGAQRREAPRSLGSRAELGRAQAAGLVGDLKRNAGAYWSALNETAGDAAAAGEAEAGEPRAGGGR